MTYRQQWKINTYLKKSLTGRVVVIVVVELESMQECEGLFQTDAWKADAEFIEGGRPFPIILILILRVSPRYLNSYVTCFNGRHCEQKVGSGTRSRRVCRRLLA